MSKQVRLGLAFFLMLSLLLVYFVIPSLAFDARGGEKITIPSGEVVDDDLYIAGETVLIDGTINGDLCACGRAIIVNGDVKGNIFAVAESISINGHSGHTVRAACRSFDISGNIDGDVIVGAADVKIADTSTIMGDFLFGAGRTRIDGLIDSDIIGGAGTVDMGNGVNGNVKLRVEKITLSSSANIKGDLTYISDEKANINEGARIAGAINHKLPVVKIRQKDSPVRPFLRIIQKVMSFLMALITGLLIILLVPNRMISISKSIGANPWPSLGWGAVILFATPPAALTVFFTIVGIPVVLIALALYGIAIYLSQIPVGLFVGSWIIRRFFKVESKTIMIGALALGLFILGLLRLIPFLGFFVSLAIILLGLGAIVVSEKEQRVFPQIET